MEIQEISTSLLERVEADDVVGARRLLERVDKKERKLIVTKRDNCDPPLFVAAKRGNADMVEFLAEECGADLEERGRYFINRMAKLVTPLWCAVASNDFEAVKRLIELGADVNAVSDPCGTPVLGACFSVMNKMSKIEKGEAIVQFLIDHESDPFIENKSGDDVFHTASYNGHRSILEKLLFKFELQLPVSRAIDLYELIGSFYVDPNVIVFNKVLQYWRKAFEMRMIHSHYGVKALQPHPVYGFTTEVSTVEKLEKLCHYSDIVYIRSLIIQERVLGAHHYRIFPALLACSLRHERNGEFRLCIDILKYAFQLENASVQRMPIQRLNGQYWISFYRLCWFFFTVHRECQQPNKIKFEDVFAVLQLVTSKVDAATGIIPSDKFPKDEDSQLMYMKVILHLVKLIIELDKNEDQLLSFRKAVYSLVHSQPVTKQRQSLLHLSVKQCTSDIEGNFFLQFQSIAVVELLLECGANVNAVDDQHNAALHLCSQAIRNLEMKQHHDSINRIAVLLLKNEAHLDVINILGDRAAKGLTSCLVEVNIQDFDSLKCLSARAIIKYKIPYAGRIITSLESFVQLHGRSDNSEDLSE